MNTYATPITTAQARYLNGLLAVADEMLDRRQAVTGADWSEARFAVRSQMLKVDELTKVEASAAITAAKANNQILSDEIEVLEEAHGITPVEVRAPKTEFVTEVGMYRVGGRIFKVLPSRQSERRYANELVGESATGYRFKYAKGAMNLIRPEDRMTADEEREFGRITGHCIQCGKLLTHPKSIDYGKGPKCSNGYKN